MDAIIWLMLVSGLLPYVATGLAKGGDKSFDNNEPRSWMEKQSGWRKRANAAQTNLLEGLPFYFAAVLVALYQDVDPERLRNLMVLWILLRLVYIAAYIAGKGSIRSLLWAASLVVTVLILFS